MTLCTTERMNTWEVSSIRNSSSESSHIIHETFNKFFVLVTLDALRGKVTLPSKFRSGYLDFELVLKIVLSSALRQGNVLVFVTLKKNLVTVLSTYICGPNLCQIDLVG